MTVQTLTIGAAGPIGRATTRELARIQVPNVATARNPTDSLRGLDFKDETASTTIMREVTPDVVLFLANPQMTPGAESDDAKAALGGLERFLQLAAETGTRRVVFASSSAVYGTTETTPRKESHPLAPESLYASYKASAEEVLRRASVQLGLEGIALRIFNVYGQGLDSSLINQIFASNGNKAGVLNTPNYVRDYIHVSDVAKALASAIRLPLSGYAAINVGTGVATDNVWLMNQPGARGDPVDVHPSYFSHSVADISAMSRLLDTSSKIRLDAAIRSRELLLG